MADPPIEIHADPSARLVACHSPASILVHWQKKVHQDLLRDEALGILEKVPQRAHAMVPSYGNNLKTWWYSSTICWRLTAQQILYAWFICFGNPVSSCPPDPRLHLENRHRHLEWISQCSFTKSDHHLTTFITPFGWWRYTRAPQGFLSSGDGYNRRFNAILAEFERKERCVDDTIFYDTELENHWWRTIPYPCRMGWHRSQSWQVSICWKQTVDFAGFRISESTVELLPKYITAIRDFPKPQSIRYTRSWFGLFNQVANYAQLGDLLQPFQPFLSPERKFEWSDNLDEAFLTSKKAIIGVVKRGSKYLIPVGAHAYDQTGQPEALATSSCSSTVHASPGH